MLSTPAKTNQNELKGYIGNHIRDSIISEINEVKWYSILCDEVTDVFVKEQVSVVIRCVDSQCHVPEEFLDFLSTQERYWLVYVRVLYLNMALILETVGVMIRGMMVRLINYGKHRWCSGTFSIGKPQSCVRTL